MAKSKFKLNTTGVKTEILQAGWMLDYVTQKAESMAGAGEEVKPFIGFDRAKAFIYSDNEEQK